MSVSGTITQLAASVATPADLTGLPDDAFLDGDFAFVASLGRSGTFQLDRASQATPDNVNVIATYTGNGVWVSTLMTLNGGYGFTLDADLEVYAAPVPPQLGPTVLLGSTTFRQPAAGGLFVSATTSFKSLSVATDANLSIEVDGVVVGGGAITDVGNNGRACLAAMARVLNAAKGNHTVDVKITCSLGSLTIDATTSPTLAQAGFFIEGYKTPVTV